VSRTRQPFDQERTSAKGFGLLVTNVVKLGGLAAGLFEILFRPDDPQKALVLAFAALAVTGGQGLESFLDRLFGK
jgi:hypothetical protein